MEEPKYERELSPYEKLSEERRIRNSNKYKEAEKKEILINIDKYKSYTASELFEFLTIA